MRNKGPSPVEYSEVTILVPFKYNKKEDPNYLLYLMEVQVSTVMLVSYNRRKIFGHSRISSTILENLSEIYCVTCHLVWHKYANTNVTKVASIKESSDELFC